MTSTFLRKAFTLIFAAGICIAGNGETGGAGGAYLRMPQSARLAAIGNAGGALAGDAENSQENPALLAFIDGRSFSSSFQFMSLDRSLSMLTAAFPLPPSAGLSVSWIHAGVGEIEERDFSNNLTGELSTTQDALCLGFANRFSSRISVGINAKVMIDQLPDVTATGFGIDAGIYVRPHEKFELGFMARDISSKMNWNTKDIYEFGSQRTDRYPPMYEISAVWHPDDRITAAAAYKGSNDIDPTLHAGLEIRTGRYYRLRAGTDDGMPVFGLGTEYPVYGKISTRIDYAYLLGRHNEGTSHAFSWIFYF